MKQQITTPCSKPIRYAWNVNNQHYFYIEIVSCIFLSYIKIVYCILFDAMGRQKKTFYECFIRVIKTQFVCWMNLNLLTIKFQNSSKMYSVRLALNHLNHQDQYAVLWRPVSRLEKCLLLRSRCLGMSVWKEKTQTIVENYNQRFINQLQGTKSLHNTYEFLLLGIFFHLFVKRAEVYWSYILC